MIHDETLPDKMIERITNENLAIFLFHGVINQQTHRVRNYTGKHIKADLFATCMKRLSKFGNALSMDEVLYFCESGEALPPRAYAVTFDDGFENNISVAAPILADFEIPAMIYITSGFVEGNQMSWIDCIENAVEMTTMDKIKVEWSNDAFLLQTTEHRIDFLTQIRLFVKNEPDCDPNVFAEQLCDQLGVPGQIESNDPIDLKMNWADVQKANESEFFSIGGHSHTHPTLSFLDDNQLAFELDTCLYLLKEEAGVSPAHFSYPEGLSHCYSEKVIKELKKRGVRCSPTAIDGINKTGADPFHLLRIMVG
jgi:peptidoglycan/xylan/chitin deacetylase (PgdA/CDA1 family)